MYTLALPRFIKRRQIPTVPRVCPHQEVRVVLNLREVSWTRGANKERLPQEAHQGDLCKAEVVVQVQGADSGHVQERRLGHWLVR